LHPDTIAKRLKDLAGPELEAAKEEALKERTMTIGVEGSPNVHRVMLSRWVGELERYGLPKSNTIEIKEGNKKVKHLVANFEVKARFEGNNIVLSAL
jgi:hypothetical protein